MVIADLQISAQTLTIVEGDIEKPPNIEQNQENKPNIPINQLKQGENNLEEIVANLLPYAKAITVKIKLPQGFGSGVLLHRQGKLYTIVTNAHVLRGEESPYQIETFDGNTYSAKTVALSENDQDLVMIQFYSPTVVYPIAQIGRLPQEGDFALAVGFREIELPEENNNNLKEKNQDEKIENNPSLPESKEVVNQKLVFTSLTGKITFVLDKPLKQGYQIGYTNEVEEGMSGGAILNQKGELIGINAMRAYPILGDPFVYEDDSIPPESMGESMMKSSWGVPINIILDLFCQINSNYNL